MQNLVVFIANHLLLVYSFAIALLLLMVVEYMRARNNRVGINPAQAVQLINRQNAVVIDVRSNDTFKKGHIIDALSLTASTLLNGAKPIEKYKKRPIIIVCHAGMESQKIAATLLNQGYNAFSLTGGLKAWTSADLPIVKE